MGRIVISENVSLDGVVQDPTGDEGFRHGGWFGRVSESDRAEWAAVEFEEAVSACRGTAAGSASYEFFADRWPSRSGAWADRLNALPKYVVSSTLVDPEWSNTTILTGDVVDEVVQLEQRVDGDIVVYASRVLVQTLIEHRLADELRLMVFPFVLGSGGRLFGEFAEMTSFRPRNVRTVGDGLVLLTYDVVLAD